jgi:hypothetical protein
MMMRFIVGLALLRSINTAPQVAQSRIRVQLRAWVVSGLPLRNAPLPDPEGNLIDVCA